jgi:restriction system protein
MARDSSGLFNDLLAAASLLPAPISLIIAVASYFGFHYLATSLPPVPSGNAHDLGNTMGRQIVMMASLFAQYLLPAIFVFGAGISFVRRLRQRRQHVEAVNHPDPSILDRISGSDFENLTAEVFRRKGYRVIARSGNGADLEAWSGKDKYLVAIRQWRSNQVGLAVVKELFESILTEQAAGGYVVASGTFTEEAWKYAEGRSIELISSDYMLSLIMETVPAQ